MRREDEPVDVRYLTRRIPATPNPTGSYRVQARHYGSGGPPQIPVPVLERVRDDIRQRTRLNINELIGAGGTGSVFVARHTELSIYRAVKVVYYADRSDRDEFIDTLKGSLSIAATMRHPGFIVIHDAEVGNEWAYIVMDLHNPDRNFRSFTASPATRARSQIVINCLEEIIEVLAYCHSTTARPAIRGSRGVFVHGDLKAENVLLDHQNRAIVTDWLVPNLGQSRAECFPYYDTRAYGTPMYMPPEQDSDGLVTPASDVWNFGVLAFESLTGFYPFESERDIYDGRAMLVSRFAPLAPAWANDVIQECLKSNYRDRPMDGDALLHLWRRASGRLSPPGRTMERPSIQRVFLSSTFTELAEERKAVISALQRFSGVERVAMEYGGSRAVSPRDACLAAIETSDLVLLLLGSDYGSVDALSGLSMTRLELEHARTCGVLVLAYVKKRPTAELLVPDPGVELDPRVREFIESLDEITLSAFANANDLAIQVVCDVARLLNAA